MLLQQSPLQDHFPGLSGHHRGKALFKFGVVQTMGDHRTDIQATLQHDGHLLPRFIHFTTVDSVDREYIEHNQIPVDGDIFRRNAEHCDFSAMRHVFQHVSKR